ncbi:MAG: c-type cytochrome [Candidatus Binatia bacterium]
MTTLPLLLLLLADLGSPLPRVATVDKGRALYMAHCSRCHGASGIGDGPDAALLRNRPADLRRSEVLDAFSDDKLAERIREGKVMRFAFRPESINRQAAETEALYQFLRKLPERSWKSIDAGEQIYYVRCTPCHDRYGHPEPALPPGVTRRPQDLSDGVFQAAISDRELRSLVRHGRRGMPAVLPRVTEAESADLVRFVRLLSPGYEIYDRFCSTCHGPHGEGATGALLTGPAPHFAFDASYFRTHTSDETRQAIWHMLEDKTPTMPHFDDTLSSAEVKAILRYLRSLPRLPSGPSGEHPTGEAVP